MSPELNPILLEVFQNLFSSIAEEMGVALCRSAFSPNIKERKDFSCALFDEAGDMIAQAAHIPVHLGSAPLSVQGVLATLELTDGDMAMVNDPYAGGTHLPDITVMAPVTLAGHRFYVANRAHHSDIGGISAGSMPLSTRIEEEGVRIPPRHIFRNGRLDEDLLHEILDQSRTPQERRGDLEAQFAANYLGIQRLHDTTQRYPPAEMARYARGLLAYAETMTRRMLAGIPDGVYEAEDYLDDDGFTSEKIPIRVRLTISGDRAVVDFTGSADQVPGSINCVRAVTVSAVFYCFKCLAAQSIPANSGGMRPLEVITPAGSVVAAEYPAAVAGGNVETSQRIVDVVFRALAGCLPDRIPAASQGTMNNISIGGRDPFRQRPFTYYETLGGGTGGGPGWAGISGIHSHMTNTLNTPVEVIRREYPFRIRAYHLRRDSGGRGRFPGGDGLVREYEFLSDDQEVTLLTERRRLAPYGLAGGGDGSPGRNRLLRADGREEKLGGKCTVRVNRGDVLRVETPGGGGWGVDDRESRSE
ncbi:MAG: hydantoinase B/oxoprolinase family protein [Acidobacteria bacterium]|nr:hydantoinase B/oxoprolinase family protein [Acidobacteriota bacterium]